MRLTLSLVIALWLGMVIAISLRLCTYAIWSTCTRMMTPVNLPETQRKACEMFDFLKQMPQV